MGEAKRRQLAVQTQALEAMVVDTPGGRIHVQWEQTNLGRQSAALASAIFESAHCPCCFGFAAWCVHGSLERDGDGLLERRWFELADGRPEFGPAIGIGLRQAL